MHKSESNYFQVKPQFSLVIGLCLLKNVWIGDYRAFNGEFAKVLAVKGSENKYIDFAGRSRELRFRYVDIEITNRYGEKRSYHVNCLRIC